MIARDMRHARAGLKSLAETAVNTTSDFADVVLVILGVSAKLERRRILDRTERGHAAAKAKGVKYGRRPKLTRSQEALARLQTGETVRDVAKFRSFNVSHSTISRLA